LNQRIQDPGEREQDIRTAITTLSRIATDTGNRHEPHEVAAELGISLID